MLFQSYTFFVFFFVFLALFPLFKNKARVFYVTVASYIFYAWWYPPYVFLLLGLTGFAFAIAQLPKLSRAWFVVIIILLFMPLCFYKYTGFILDNLGALFGFSNSFDVSWKLPLGISFITFTAVAYLVDVRKGRVKAERSFPRFALFISFFPQLIAGPIMRSWELLPQIKHLYFNRKMVKLGLMLFAIGMLKKTVFADQIAMFVDKFYDVNSVADLPHSLFAFYGFAVQIYCDFSGYMDMALGLAFVLGIRLPLNFNRPYQATSIQEFWHRWHMTLSRWLRDYLYIPLGGSRQGLPRTMFSLAATMVLGGLWHGAAWTFVIWGAFHAFFLVLEKLIKVFVKVKFEVPVLVKRVFTFHIVCFSWILFRARGWDEVGHILRGFFVRGSFADLFSTASFAVILIIICLLFHKWDRVSFSCWMVKKLPGTFIYAIVIMIILISKVLSAGSPSAFIYFDF